MSGTTEGTPGWETTMAYLCDGYETNKPIKKKKKIKNKNHDNRK